MTPSPLFVLRWLLASVALVGLGSLRSKAQTIHALIVADTQDPLLQRACAYDVEVMHQQAGQVAAALGYRLAEQRIVGEALSRKRLDEVLRALAPQPNDILLFYYSGHGYNRQGRPDRFPILMLEKKAANAQRNPGLGTIHQLLKAKKARLCVTFGDCCNNLLTTTRGMIRKKPTLGALSDSLNAAYRTLFLQTKGDVLIASSAPPQQACAHPDSGSFYTRAFNEALGAMGQANRVVSWQTLLRDAQIRLNRHAATRSKQSLFSVNVALRPSVEIAVASSPVPESSGIETEPELAVSSQAVVIKQPATGLPDPLAVLDTLGQPATSAALNVQLRTNRGRHRVEYQQGDSMAIDVKASRPCHLRLVYLLADGTKTLLETDFEIKPGQENRYVRVAPEASLECAAPFGTEFLLAYAAETPFCPLPTTPNSRLYVRNEGGYRIFVGSLAETIRAARCTLDGQTVVEDRIQLLTRPARDGKL